MKQNQQGSIVLIALLVMVAIMATTLALSSLIIGHLRISAGYDHSMQAYYAAETGIEKSLWKIRSYREKSNTLEDAIYDIEEGENIIDPLRNVSYNIPVGSVLVDIGEFTTIDLGPDESFQLDFFDPTHAGRGGGAAYLDISDWSDDCAGCTQMEMTLLEWPASSGVDLSRSSITKVFRTFGERTTRIPLQSSSLYTVRFKNLNTAAAGTITSLTIKALDDSDEFARLPSHITLYSEGKFGSSKQSMWAVLPWHLTSQSLFDYVLFSEKRVDK